MDNQSEKFDLWCIVELFGHQQIAGKCTEQNIAGTNMLRVDVPETSQQGAFTKFYGAAAIYAINPVTEEVAKARAEQLQKTPINSWDIKAMQDKMTSLQLASSADSIDDDEFPY